MGAQTRVGGFQPPVGSYILQTVQYKAHVTTNHNRESHNGLSICADVDDFART